MNKAKGLVKLTMIIQEVRQWHRISHHNNRKEVKNQFFEELLAKILCKTNLF